VSERLLEVRGLTVRFPVRGAGLLGPRNWLVAVNEVDLDVAAGQAVGLVGESGCGKSTLARAILGLITPQSGTISWRGRPVTRADATGLRQMRREVQVVFQDPVGSLDPRMTIGESVAEALAALGGPAARDEAWRRVTVTLEEVGLDAALASRYPHELSGGQCQRAAIARAIVARPKLLVCDEAVSALDVSVQAQIVNLLAELRRRHGLSLLFISHNLAVVRHLCDEVLVVYRGRVLERATRAGLFCDARHPYTRLLLAAVPDLDPDHPRNRAGGPGGVAEPTDPARDAPGCPFRERCPVAVAQCGKECPALESIGGGHAVACHLGRDGTTAG
jgi:oligopeptide transport system ATP-binding protein